MEVKPVLIELIKEFQSLPVLKLAWNGAFSSTLNPASIPNISPAHLLKELSYSSIERHQLLLEQQSKIKSGTGKCLPKKIRIEPPIVAFQNFKKGETQSCILTVQNIYKTMQKVIFKMDESGPFAIDESSRRVARFPTGMTTSIRIVFKPDYDEDYYHKLIVIVDSEKISIPLIAIGGKGFLEFPDKISFGKVPVKISNKRTYTVINNGKKAASVQLSTNKPFGITPERGFAHPGEPFTFTILFNSKELVKSFGNLKIKYASGEEVNVILEAETINQQISIEPPDVEMKDSYVGMIVRNSFTICNNGRSNAKFQWKNYSSPYHYVQSEKKDGDSLKQMPHGNRKSSASEKHLFNSKDRHSNQILKRIELSKSIGYDAIEKEEPLFSHDVFKIEPIVGEIQAFSSKEFSIFFLPNRPGMIFSDAYCEIDGLEERLELRMIGKGIGPKFQFSFDVLDVGKIFLGGMHTYEIPITNVSDIEGKIVFKDSAGVMDPKLIIEPREMKLSPGEYSAFYVHFGPMVNCQEIFEELRFVIPLTGEIMTILIKGNSAFPSIRFECDNLDLEEVAYGFPVAKQIRLVNESLMELEVSLAIEPDGTDPVLQAEDMLEALKNPDFNYPLNPREFQIEPSRFQLSPHGFQRIVIRMIPAKYGKYENVNLSARIGDGEEIVKQIPVIVTCVPPTFIRPSSPIVVHTVDGFPTESALTIHNPSKFSAVYCLIPNKSNTVLLSSDCFMGIVKSYESINVKFEVITTHSGEHNAKIDLYIAGKTELIFDMDVLCLSISPIGSLKLSTSEIDLGECKVRQKTTETLQIFNNSPSNAIPFSIILVTENSSKMREVWEVDPSEHGLAKPDNVPNPVTVSVTLNEVGSYNAVFHVQVLGSNDHLEIKAKATGIGCALLFNPEIEESGIIDVGSIFINIPTILTYEVSNPGFLRKNLEWRLANEDAPANPSVYEGKKTQRQPTATIGKSSQKKKQQLLNPAEISPSKYVLEGDKAYAVQIKLYSTTTKPLDASYTLWAYAELPNDLDKDFQARINKAKASGNQPIGKKIHLCANDKVYLPTPAKTIKLIGNFENPKLKFSPSKILFRIEPNPIDYSDIFKQTIGVHFENPCNEPLAVIFHTHSPFGVGLKSGKFVQEYKRVVQPKEKFVLDVTFDISRQPKDSGLDIFKGSLEIIYEKHSKSDSSIQLIGELFMPTVLLDTDSIDFGDVANGKEASLELFISNPGKFCITYYAYIIEETVSMKVSDTKQNTSNADYAHVQTLDLLYTSSDLDIYEQEQKQVEKPNSEPCSSESDAKMTSNSTAITSDWKTLEDAYTVCEEHKTRNNYEEFYRMKLMSFLGLSDPPKEPNDELTYFHYFPIKPKINQKENIFCTANEIIDIIPATGLLPSGTKQKLTVVFYPQSNIQFSAKICISIENGLSKFFNVTGSSIPPPNPYEITKC